MIELGRFHIDLEMRTLRKDGEPVHLGSRAFDILAVVASAGGRLVTKDELMNAVWPNTIVEENNIQVHLSALRKILGADRDLILTVPGRGYQLVRRSNRSAPGQSFAPAPAACPLPPPKTHLVGRQAAVRQIRAMLAHAHVLTLVGAGGIGKTSLAIEAARHAAADFVEVCFVELAALTAHGGVLAAIAEGCGLAAADAAPGVAPGVAQMAAALAQKRRLLVLDNAEHLVDEVAEVVEALVAECASLRVLVTSREPLRIMPEAIFRVDPLDVPQPDSSDAEILQQSAVNLFLLRANSLQRKVGAERAELRLVGEICRRLDGIPLAIELAAARVVALGVEGVYQRLDDRMAILAGGYRTALPRHQTLRATFDWSFALLDAGAQSLFRRIAVFGGLFTFEAMCAVVCDASLTVASAINGISELLAKSLVNVEFDGPVARYRLSESTRAYALEKLQAEGERQDLAARHARYLACCLQARPARTAAGAASSTDSSAADHAAVFQHSLDDACSALDWAFSAEGDVRLGVELASNLAGALLDAGMIAECCARTGQAVDALDKLPAASVAAVSEMRVRAALASALPYIHGAVGRSAELWRDVLALALACGDEAFHARALWGLWNTMMSGGNIHESMKYAKRFQQFAQAQAQENPWQQILADQLVAISLHCLGRHGEARQALLDVRQRIVSLDGKAQRVGSFAVDPLVYCNGTLARIAWLEGNVGEALALVDQLVSLVRPHTMEPSLTHVLGAAAVPLALLSGDLSGGAAYLEIMRSQTALHRSEVWLDYCDCLSAYRDILDGHAQRALPVLAQALDALIARGFRRLITLFIVAYAEALVTAGQIHEARSRLNEALAFCESNGELIFLPEIWRVLGLAAHAEARAQAYAGNASNARRSDASACFAKAIELSRTQGARMWELRASMALAALLRDEGRTEAELELLERIALCFDAASGSADVDALFETIATLRSRSGKPLRRAAFDNLPPLDTRAALAAPASAG